MGVHRGDAALRALGPSAYAAAAVWTGARGRGEREGEREWDERDDRGGGVLESGGEWWGVVESGREWRRSEGR